MKKAITIWAFSEGISGKISTLYASELTKSCGFDALEISFCEKGEISLNTTVNEYKSIYKTLKEKSLSLSSISTLMLNDLSIISLDKDERALAMKVCKKMIDAANLLEIPTISISPGKVSPFNHYIDYYNDSIEQVGEILEYSMRNGVVLCLENVWQGLLLSPLDMERYINSFNCNNLGVCIDIGNAMLNSFPQHWLRAMGSKVKKIHITDLKKRRNTIYEFKDPGLGDADWNEIMKAVHEIGFNDYMTVEAFSRPDICDIERLQTINKYLNDIMEY